MFAFESVTAYQIVRTTGMTIQEAIAANLIFDRVAKSEIYVTSVNGVKINIIMFPF